MARITKRTVEAIRPADRDVFAWDDELRGFGVRVYPSGARKYLIQWKRGGRTRRLVLGTHGPTTAEEARKRATVLLGRIEQGQDPAEERDARKADLTLAELLDRYLAEGAGHLKRPTRATYRSAFERHVKPLLGGRKLRSLARADVERLREDVANGRTAATVEGEARKRGRVVVRGGAGIAGRVVAYLASALAWAERRGLLEASPARGVRLPQARRRERYLTGEEFRRLGEALAAAEARGANPFFVAAVRLLALTGCRKSEVARLRWAEVDLAAGVLRLADSKTGARVVPLPTLAQAILAGLPRVAGSPWVLPSRVNGGPIVGLRKFFAGLTAAAGLEGVTPHTLRHSLASVAVQGGGSIYLLKGALGHSNVATTERYSHLSVDPVRAVVEAASAQIGAALAAGRATSPDSCPAEVLALRRRAGP